MTRPKILVTGGAGFIGSHLTRRLVERGYSLIVLDNFQAGRRENLTDCPESIRLVEADIRNLEIARRAMRGVDLVFHLAAKSNVMGACAARYTRYPPISSEPPTSCAPLSAPVSAEWSSLLHGKSTASPPNSRFPRPPR